MSAVGTAPVRVTRAGTRVDGSPADFDALRAEFDGRHCVVLRGFVAPDLLAMIQQKLDMATFVRKTNPNIGDELRLPPDRVAGGLEFLLNDPAVFAVAERITGCQPIGCYRARVYRLMPQAGHSSDWHTDLVEGRMLTMSINLSAQRFEGGLLQIRDADTGQVLSEVANTGFGDAVIFRIDPTLQHRVTPITGDTPRTAYAGWFLREPAFATELRRRLDAVVRSTPC